MYTYKTKDGSEQVIPGIGATVNGVIKTDRIIESPLFELVEDSSKSQPAAPQPTAPVALPPAPAQQTNPQQGSDS